MKNGQLNVVNGPLLQVKKMLSKVLEGGFQTNHSDAETDICSERTPGAGSRGNFPTTTMVRKNRPTGLMYIYI
jgi:hypothetical protein